MAKIAINMITTEQGTGRKLQKTLTDINAEATSQQIKTFATALNGLTTNVYGETNRIEKLNVDTEEAPSGGGSNTPETLYLTICNAQDEVIGTTAVTKYTYEQACAVLTDVDLNTLEVAYEDYQSIGVAHEGFCWLAGDIVEEDAAYAIYGFATQISEPEVHTDGAPMDVVGAASPYYAKLTTVGIALWIQASE